MSTREQELIRLLDNPAALNSVQERAEAWKELILLEDALRLANRLQMATEETK